MNETEDVFIRQTLKQAMRDDLPAAVAEGMQNRLESLQQQFDTKASTIHIPTTTGRRRGKPLGWAAAAVTAAALLLAVLFVSRSWNSAAWAEVVASAAESPCLHYVTTYEDGRTVEGWFSASRAVLVARATNAGSRAVVQDADRLFMIDFSQNTRDWFDREKNVIVRTTEEPFRTERAFFEAFFSALLSNSLGQAFDTGHFQLDLQQQRAVTEGPERWIEYRFEQRNDDEKTGRDTEWVVSVNPDTRLPFRWEQFTRAGVDSAAVRVGRSDIDYPGSYPTDMHALGVPKTAKVADRTLRPDVEKLVAETVAPKHWAGNTFSALVVESSEDQVWWQGHSIYKVWNDGLRWKVERSMGPVTMPNSQSPRIGTDPKAWWTQKAAEHPFRPDARCDSKWYWRYDTKTRRPTSADTASGWPKDTMVIVSIKEKRERPVRKDRFMRPYPLGFSGHITNPFEPPLPLFPGFVAAVDLEPESGPPNTVLLEVRNPNWKLGNSPAHKNPQIWRLWIDPARDYLVIRYEQLTTRNGEETVDNGFAIDELMQAPQGKWYPMVVRRLRTNHPAVKRKEGFLRFYYDFSGSIPPEVFEVD